MRDGLGSIPVNKLELCGEDVTPSGNNSPVVRSNPLASRSRLACRIRAPPWNMRKIRSVTGHKFLLCVLHIRAPGLFQIRINFWNYKPTLHICTTLRLRSTHCNTCAYAAQHKYRENTRNTHLYPKPDLYP